MQLDGTKIIGKKSNRSKSYASAHNHFRQPHYWAFSPILERKYLSLITFIFLPYFQPNTRYKSIIFTLLFSIFRPR